MESVTTLQESSLTLPRLLVGNFADDLLNKDLSFEPIIHNGRTSAEVHWLYKPEETNGSAAAIIRYYAGGSGQMHLHTGYELIYILEGEMVTTTGVVKKNDLILLKPGSAHASNCSDGCVALIIWQQPVQTLLASYSLWHPSNIPG